MVKFLNFFTLTLLWLGLLVLAVPASAAVGGASGIALGSVMIVVGLIISQIDP